MRTSPQSARLAEEIGDYHHVGVALLNLSSSLCRTDPATAADTARAAAGHLRRAGDRDFLARAITNLAVALQLLGDWDTAKAELTHAADADGLADHEFLACHRAWLAAMRGDAGTAEAVLMSLPGLRASEDAQEQALISLVEAFTAATSRGTRCAVPAPRSLMRAPSVDPSG